MMSTIILEPSRETALLAGATADRILRKPRFIGYVIAVGSKAAFVISGQDLVAFSRTDQQPHPRAVLSSLDLGALQLGMPATVKGDDVVFCGGETLSLGPTPPWLRQPVGAGRGVSLGNARRGFDRVLDIALAMHRGENLGSALPVIAAGFNTQEADCPTSADSPLIGAAIEHIRRVVPLCRSGRFDLAVVEAETLIGLGPGLTPSGDDFVGGLLFAAYHMKEAFPDKMRWSAEGDERAVAGLLARSVSMTNPISHALLRDHALGQSYEAIHNLMDGILTGDSDFDIETQVTQVTGIGSSSGWDMLTGLLTGMLLVKQSI